MTPSIPFKAVTREIVDAIHTRTTVLTIVIYTVIDVCKFNKTQRSICAVGLYMMTQRFSLETYQATSPYLCSFMK